MDAPPLVSYVDSALKYMLWRGMRGGEAEYDGNGGGGAGSVPEARGEGDGNTGQCEWRVAETEDSFAPIVEHVKLAFDIATSTVFMMAAIGVLGATICESCRPNATRCSVGASELLCKARFDAWLVGVLCLVQIS